MQILSDPVWLGLIFTALGLLAAIFIPLVIYLKSKNNKEISYRDIAIVPLFHINYQVKENFEVLFQGEPVSNATLISVEVWNSGNVPIEEADFIDPIKLSYGDEADIIFASIGSNPENILSWIKLEKNGKYLTFKPRLLNKGYRIVISSMVSGFSETIKVEGLIKGVHDIRKSNIVPDLFQSRNVYKYSSYIFQLMLSICIIVSLITGIDLIRQNNFGDLIQLPKHPTDEQLIFLMTFVFGFMYAFFLLLLVSFSQMTKASQNKTDAIYIRDAFSLLQAHKEKESQNQISQQTKKTTPSTSQGKILKEESK